MSGPRIILDGVDMTNVEVTSLNDLSDVTITSVADNELLAFDSGTGEWINQTPTEAGLDSVYVRVDGTVELTANWDAGSFNITAETFESDVATGTAPLTVASTTLVTNLNVDKLDGRDVGTSANGIAALDNANTWSANQGFFGTVELQFRSTSQRIYSPFATILTIDSGAATIFEIASATEMTLVGNALAFENGVTDTSIDWSINGQLAFKVGATTEGFFSSIGLDVLNILTAQSVRMDGDSGGTAVGTVITLTNVEVAVGTGSAATLGNVVTKGEGPQTTAQSGWEKVYIGTTAKWLATWVV